MVAPATRLGRRAATFVARWPGKRFCLVDGAASDILGLSDAIVRHSVDRLTSGPGAQNEPSGREIEK